MLNPPNVQANIAQTRGNPLCFMIAKAFVSSSRELKNRESISKMARIVLSTPYTMTIPKMRINISADDIIEDDKLSINEDCLLGICSSMEKGENLFLKMQKMRKLVK